MTKRSPDPCSPVPTTSKRAKTAAPPFPPTPLHPLGIRPLGNQLLAKTDPDYTDTRTLGLGRNTFSKLSDDFLLAWIVTYLNCPHSLGRLSQASKAWYAWYAHDEMWKAWVLEHWQALPAQADRSFYFSSWRRTYIHLVAPGHRTSNLTISARHMYSDLLYQPHLYATTPLSYVHDMLQYLTDQRFVRSMDAINAPSTQTFSDLYGKTGTPVLLRGCMHDWSAMHQWTDWNTFEHLFGHVRLRAEAVDLTLSEYLSYMHTSPRDEAPVYLFDKDFPRQGPAGAQIKAGYTVPPYFSSDLFSVLGPTRPDHAWLIIGPERSGSTHHKDPNMTSAWNAVIMGAKLWILYPPNVTPPGVYPSDNGANVSTPISLVDWWLNHLPATKQMVNDMKLPMDQRPIWGICRVGEIVFVPNGWWHTVINLEPSLAITQNFVSKHNLCDVLSFLNSSRDMVSGYGNADDAAAVGETANCISQRVDAGKLYECFVSGLRQFKADDKEIMKIVDEFELQAAEAMVDNPDGVTNGKPTSLWKSIVQGNECNVGDHATSRDDQPTPVFTLFG